MGELLGVVDDEHAMSLTKREEEVWGLRASGMTNTEIAERLGISPQRVGQLLKHGIWKQKRNTAVREMNK